MRSPSPYRSLRASATKHPNVNQWLEFSSPERIVVRTGKVEIGQHISTALALLAAEELRVDIGRIDVRTASTDTSPDEGFTSGSNSMEESGQAIRLAAATAKQVALERAAAQLGADASALEVDDGLIRVAGTNRSLTYWDLNLDEALECAIDPDAPLIPSESFEQIGQPTAPIGLVELVTGAAKFAQDLAPRGALHARVVRPPHYKAQLSSIPEDSLQAFPTARLTVDGSFVAVVATDEFTAIRAAEALATRIVWNHPTDLGSGDIFDQLRANERVSLPVMNGTPELGPLPAELAPTSEEQLLIATYERPYQMHASLGGSAAMAELSDGKFTVWTHSQGIFPLRASLAETLGVPDETLTLVHQPGPGCYGHNGADDAALDAALVARAFPGERVVLKWSREDEHAWEPYSSCMRVELAATTSPDGAVTHWSHETYSDTHVNRPRPGGDGIGPSRLLSARYLADPFPPQLPQPNTAPHGGIHRNADPLYSFPRRRIVKHLVRGLPLRVSAMRTLGAYANVFAAESFMDELALAQNTDPVQFRLRHMADERACAVIEACAALMDWPTTRPEGVGKGLAFAQYKNAKAYAAVGVELRVSELGDIQLHRAYIAGDAGEIIDRDGLALQLEGGVIQAASWTLYEAVAFDAGGIVSRDWDSYPILRFGNVPRIETTLIERPGDPPLGAGEATSGPTAAAIANAVFDACGLRLRRLPFTREAVRNAAAT